MSIGVNNVSFGSKKTLLRSPLKKNRDYISMIKTWKLKLLKGQDFKHAKIPDINDLCSKLLNNAYFRYMERIFRK